MQCTHQECQTTAGCAHRGPLGQMCYFPPQFFSCIEHERRIADLEARLRIWRDDYARSADGTRVEIPVHQIIDLIGERTTLVAAGEPVSTTALPCPTCAFSSPMDDGASRAWGILGAWSEQHQPRQFWPASCVETLLASPECDRLWRRPACRTWPTCDGAQ